MSQCEFAMPRVQAWMEDNQGCAESAGRRSINVRAKFGVQDLDAALAGDVFEISQGGHRMILDDRLEFSNKAFRAA